MAAKPKIISDNEKEIESINTQVDAFDASIRSLNLDTLNKAPIEEREPQTKLSQQELENKGSLYLKPHRTIGCKDKFNEDYRKEWEFSKEYVQFIAENNMVIGETIDMWTKPFAGIPAEWWKIPVNKPVWAPRHVAEQIKRARHHSLIMKESGTTGSDHTGSYYGEMAVEKTVQRLDAKPVSNQKSIFMGR